MQFSYIVVTQTYESDFVQKLNERGAEGWRVIESYLGKGHYSALLQKIDMADIVESE